MLEKGHWGHPCHFPFVQNLGPRRPSAQPLLPARATAQAATHPTVDCHAHSRHRHSLEPHTDERAELDIHLRMCSVVGHIHRLHCLGGHSCHTGAPAASPGVRPHPWPCLPDRAAPPGSELCHLHPTWGRGEPKAARCAGLGCSPAMMLPGPLPTWGTGAVTCMSYTAPGENTPSRSLSPPPGLLPGGCRERT